MKEEMKDSLTTYLDRLIPAVREALENEFLYDFDYRPNIRSYRNWIKRALDVEQLRYDPEGWLLALDEPTMVKHLRIELCTNKHNEMCEYLKQLDVNPELLDQALNTVVQDDTDLSHLVFNNLGLLPKQFKMHPLATFVPNRTFSIDLFCRNEALSLVRSIQYDVVTQFKEGLGEKPDDNKFGLDPLNLDPLLLNILAYRTAPRRPELNPDSLVNHFFASVYDRVRIALQALFNPHNGEDGLGMPKQGQQGDVTDIAGVTDGVEDAGFERALATICYTYFPDTLRNEQLSEDIKLKLQQLNNSDGCSFSERLTRRLQS